MRHLGWLHSIPEGSKKSRVASFTASDENHPFLEMPDIDTECAAGYLVGLLHEAGLMSSSGMGPVPLSWTEINAWLQVTELELTVWERLTIKRMSEDYVGERCETDPNRPAPYSRRAEEAEDLQDEREKVNDKIMSLLGNWVRRSDSGSEDGADPADAGEDEE